MRTSCLAHINTATKFVKRVTTTTTTTTSIYSSVIDVTFDCVAGTARP